VHVLLTYLLDFKRDHFRWKFFFPLFTFLTVCFLVNYRYQFKDVHVGYAGDDPVKYVRIFLFYLLPLIVSFVLYSFLGPLKKNREGRPIFGDNHVWLFLGFAAAAYTAAVGWTPFEPFIRQHAPVQAWSYLTTVSSFFLRAVLMLALPGIWWWFADRGDVRSYYGFRVSPGLGRPYMVLAVIAVLIALAASMDPGFAEFYPMAKPSGPAAQVLNMRPITMLLIWEVVYIGQFVALELFFRGFLVLGLGRLMGGGSVWVMASMYMFIHFSKPPAEAIASFFAGILLGVLAYRTRSIYGGVILHVTIALSMDMFALLWKGI